MRRADADKTAVDRPLSFYGPFYRNTGLSCLLLAAVLIAGCKTSYDTAAKNAEPLSDVLSMPEQSPDPLPEVAHWWTSFEDEGLNTLIDHALAHNFSIRSAWDRLSQAQAILRRSGAERSVQLDGNAGLTQRWQETNGRDSNSTSLSVGLAASYEIDLWGRIQNSIQAAELDTAASRFAIDTAAITLSAQVADAYFRHRVSQAQIRLIDSQIETNENVLEIIQERFRTGVSQAQDVLRQRQLIESTQSERINAIADKHLIENELAVLLGALPRVDHLDESIQAILADSSDNTLTPAYLTDSLSVVPSQQVFVRPDIYQQYARVQAADARVAAAMADRYPRLSLSASVNFEDEGVKDLFDNWAATLAANLAAPLIDGGRRQAEVERNQAALSEQVNAYAQSVLQAIKEVQDALTVEARQRDQLVNVQSRLKLSKEVLQTLRTSYRNGASSYLDVLDALGRDQTLARQYLTDQQRTISARITLHRTIAGSMPLTSPAPAKLAERSTDQPGT